MPSGEWRFTDMDRVQGKWDAVIEQCLADLENPRAACAANAEQ